MRGRILLLLALAVGLAVGYLLGASKERTAPARADRAPAAPLPPPDVRPSGNTSLAQALRDLPLPAVDRGTGSISGRVTRPDGTPVSGVAVRAMLAADHGRGTPSDGQPPPDIEEEVRRFVADAQQRRMSAVEALTGSGGRYTLPGLADGVYDLSGSLTGFRVSARGASRARPGASVDFIVDAAVDVTFDVRLPDGTPAPDATIHLKSGSASSAEAWSRDDQRIALRPGTFLCTAVHGDGDYHSDAVPVEVREGAPAPPTVLLQLKSRSGIRGTIFFPKDLPFPDASVCAMAFTGEKPPDPKLLVEQEHQAWTTLEQGFRYRILDLPAGRYLVGVVAGMALVATQVVDVGNRIETCDFAIDTIDPGLYVIVHVLDPAGKPVLDATFGIGYRVDNGYSASTNNTMPMRPDGSYIVAHYSHDQQEGGTYFITVESPRYGKREIDYRREETKELTVRFLDAATLEVTIAGFASSEHSGALTVGLVPAHAAADDRFSAESASKAPDREGRVTFGPVEASEYDLTLYAGAGERSETLVAGTRRITLGPGKNTVSMPMPRLFTLAVTDPERKAQGLQLQMDGGNSLRRQVDEAGRAVFAALPEGRYLVGRMGDANGAMRVTLPGPSEIVFRPQPFDALRVTVTVLDGVWAKAGLADGDLIVAIDGEEMRSNEEMRVAQAMLPTKDTATVGILRGGRRIELRVNAKALFESDDGRVDGSIR